MLLSLLWHARMLFVIKVYISATMSLIKWVNTFKFLLDSSTEKLSPPLLEYVAAARSSMIYCEWFYSWWGEEGYRPSYCAIWAHYRTVSVYYRTAGVYLRETDKLCAYCIRMAEISSCIYIYIYVFISMHLHTQYSTCLSFYTANLIGCQMTV